MSSYYILTGGAGFIGSNLLRGLNARGVNNVIVVDNLERADKFKNLVGCDFADYLDKREFRERLAAGDFDRAVDAVLHQGACSDTMASDGRYVMDNNYGYSMALLDFCQDEEIPLLYASSAAVYGGSTAFREGPEFESPLNVYGYSKLLFDQIVRRRLPESSAQIVGFRYFNVYGPGEAHKGKMASVGWHMMNQYRAEGHVRLFEGSGGYANGEQRRDFVTVDDIVKVNFHFLERPDTSGIFNVGSGRAHSFNQLAHATVNALTHQQGGAQQTFEAMQSQGLVRYIEFPQALVGKYQHFTEADIAALREAGYDQPFSDVYAGMHRYVDALPSRGT